MQPHLAGTLATAVQCQLLAVDAQDHNINQRNSTLTDVKKIAKPCALDFDLDLSILNMMFGSWS
jgi:hypothetical protein